MTIQYSETITYQGKERSLEACPLEDYFILAKKSRPFISHLTALWRGYIGHWEIIDDRLYLIEVNSKIGNDNQSIILEDIFPGFSERVFAHWYSGRLNLPDGNLGSFNLFSACGSEPERYIVLEVRKGKVTNTFIEQNERYIES
ncbi:hypothetical protein [Colwellia sp. MEBiC06753]